MIKSTSKLTNFQTRKPANPRTIGNGGTYQLVDGRLVDAEFDSGYLVGIKTKTVSKEFESIAEFFQLIKEFAIENNAKLVGFWLDTKTGIYHVDIVQHKLDISASVRLALENNQLAIWDCKDSRDLRLDDHQIDERTYGGQIVRRYLIGNRHFVLVFDLIDQYGNENFVDSVFLDSDIDLVGFNKKYNPRLAIDRGIVRYCNEAESQHRRESNVNGLDV